MKLVMKLLKDVKMFCIKVDYFMWDEVMDRECTAPHYLSIDTETKNKQGECMNLIIFREEINPDLRVFDTRKEAAEYIKTRMENPCFCENVRIVEVKYNFETNKWEEI